MDSERGRQEEQQGGGRQQYSTSELMASAKVVAEAAQSGFGKESSSADKAKVAEAAGDLLGAARQYGKLDEKGVGQYVEKAEDYLEKYGSGGGGGHQSEKPSEESKPEGESESGGAGGFMKMAQGFMK